MSPNQLRSALDARGLATQVAAGAALRVSHATVSRWLNAVDPIPGWVEVALAGIPTLRKDTKRARSRATVPAKSSK